MSQEKPGLSNDEFIKKWKEVIPTAEFVPERGVKLSIFMQALDRLEALIGQGQAERDAEKKVYVDHVRLLQGKVWELEVELEARKKAWKEVKAWATKTRDGAIGETGTSLYFNEFVEKLTALEVTLPKGGA